MRRTIRQTNNRLIIEQNPKYTETLKLWFVNKGLNPNSSRASRGFQKVNRVLTLGLGMTATQYYSPCQPQP